MNQSFVKSYILVQVEALKQKKQTGNVLFLVNIKGYCFQDKSTATQCKQCTSKWLVVQCQVLALLSADGGLHRFGSGSLT